VISFFETKYSTSTPHRDDHLYRLKYEHSKEKEEMHAKMNTIEQRMKTLERALQERERTHLSIVETYEARI
jgi:hypothetical protein